MKPGMRTAKIRFTVVDRGRVRTFLGEIKSQVLWQEPDVMVLIEETKVGLMSHFEFQAHGLSEVLAEAVKITFNKAKCQEELI
jgi:hypothetical protein